MCVKCVVDTGAYCQSTQQLRTQQAIDNGNGSFLCVLSVCLILEAYCQSNQGECDSFAGIYCSENMFLLVQLI